MRRARAAAAQIYTYLEVEGSPSEAQMPVLAAIVELYDKNGGIPGTLNEVEEMTGLSHSSNHEAVHRLLEKNLVEKVAPGRKWRNIAPTERGRSFL